MPARNSGKYNKGTHIYLTSVPQNMHNEGWRTIEEAGEEVYYSVYSHGITYNDDGRVCLDIVNQRDINDMPVNAKFGRVEVKAVLLASEYENLKAKGYKEPEPIDAGTLVTINNSSGGRIIYAKIMSVERSMFGDQYDVITTGSNVAHTLRRGDISLPKEVYNVRDVALRQPLMEYKEGTEAQIIGGFLYIGVDDILVHEKFATNKKLI